MLTTRSQRWRARRARYVDNDTFIDPKLYTVDVIETAQARRFVVDNHYLSSWPAARLAVGLFGPGPGGRPSLAGVAVFGVPTTGAVITSHSGMPADEGCALSRLVLAPEVAANGESFTVARALRALRREKPAMKTVVSHSDPGAGHVGLVYQALSALYRGQSAPRTSYWVGGRSINGRTISKIRLGERGAAGAVDQLVALGAPRPGLREPLPEWLDRLSRERVIRRGRLPGLHSYCIPLTPRARARARSLPIKPYPRIADLPDPQFALAL